MTEPAVDREAATEPKASSARADEVLPALDHGEQGYTVAALCPIALILFYAAVLRLRKAERSGPSSAIFAIFGIWVLALTFTMLAQTVRGNGFSGGAWTSGDFGYLLVSSFLPTRIIEFVSLEGSSIALSIGTVTMVICHIAFERARWVVPRNLFGALKLEASTRNR